MNDTAQECRLVFVGHGSRSQQGYEQFEAFTRLFRDRFPALAFSHGYLEFNEPNIKDAVRAAIKSGGKGPIVVAPAILATATHVKNDLPLILQEIQAEHPHEDIRFANVLDLHSKLLDLCSQRVAEAEASSNKLVSRADTCLVVVGRGTSDPDANGDIAKITRILHEGMKFGGSHVCFSGTTFPLVAEGLRQAAKLGFKRLIVLPYFLFDGILVQRIYAAADGLQRRLGDSVEIVKAKYLGVENATVEVFFERAMEAVNGRASMNCMTCKYRTPIVGYESEVGKPQQAHRSKADGRPYEMHPIEAKSFEIIRSGMDWSNVPEDIRCVVERLIHTTGEFGIVDDLFISRGAVTTGIDALLRCKRIVTDVTMVQAGLRRKLLTDLNIQTWCGVHHSETAVLAEKSNITRSAAGIRRAWSMLGNDLVLAIGDAPTAVVEAVRLINEKGWRPQLVIGLPVGFVGTAESKDELKNCLQVPRITNRGTRGGSPWAAAVLNALLIEANNRVFKEDAATV